MSNNIIHLNFETKKRKLLLTPDVPKGSEADATMNERLARIRASLTRINKLMASLKTIAETDRRE